MGSAKKRGLFVVIGLCFLAILTAIVVPGIPAYQEWQYQKASLETLRSGQAGQPDSPILLYYLGRRLADAHQPEEAIPVLRRATALAPGSARVQQALVLTLLSTGQTQEAAQIATRSQAAHPDDPDAALLLARVDLATKSYAPAVTALQTVTRQFPQNVEAWALLAIAQRRTGDMQGAVASVSQTTRLRPTESKYWYLQAQIDRQSMQDPRASYARALSLAPGDVRVKADYADYLARIGDTAAEKMARETLAQSPDNPIASGALGLTLARRNAPEAYPWLVKAAQSSPTDLQLLIALHKIAVQTGRTSDSKRWLSETLRVQAAHKEEAALNVTLDSHPHDANALRQMASLVARRGDSFGCVQYLARATGQSPDAPGPLLAAARDLQQGGFPELARNLAAQALQSNPTPAERAAAEALLRKP